MRDVMHDIRVVPAIAPVVVVDNTATVSSIIDMQGAQSCAFYVITGTLVDVDATFAVLLQEGSAANLSDATTVADTDMQTGTPGHADKQHWRRAALNGLRARELGEHAKLTEARMTMALVVQGFPYAANGVAVRWLAAGITADIRSDLLAGLVEAGTVTLDGASSLASAEPAAPDAAARGVLMQTGSGPDGGYLGRRRPRR
jgi:hypothetical protein